MQVTAGKWAFEGIGFSIADVGKPLLSHLLGLAFFRGSYPKRNAAIYCLMLKRLALFP